MERYLRSNQALWDLWARHHVASPMYDLEGFKAGRRAGREALDALEVRLVGDVAGRSLLHLQCHFGLDTLAWARRGAAVTGVDFSGEAIAAARALSEELHIPATFIQADVYDLPERLDGEFDIVFASHGVLCWLPDLDRWARVAARLLRPGGRFCLIEGHPFPLVFDDETPGRELRIAFPYFHAADPVRAERRGSYAAPDGQFDSVTYEWAHPLSDVIGAMLRAGLRITSFDEYPYVGWPMFPWMEARPDGTWRWPGDAPSPPLMYSLTAGK
ncbi:MAG: class I SAM-dependent methyltransferase [bacterium]